MLEHPSGARGRAGWILLGLLPLLAAGAFLLWGQGASPSAGRRPRDVVIATGTDGGTYAALGEGVAEILRDLPQAPIQTARTLRTPGSVENLERLVAGDVELALVAGQILVDASPETRARVRVLARLHDDLVQVVVRRGLGAEELDDLRGLRVYLGASGSGTEVLATCVLGAAGIDGEAVLREGEDFSFRQAADALIAGELDAAVFLDGIRTRAVSEAVTRGGCRLLGLPPGVVAGVRASHPGIETATIPRAFYRGQCDAVSTVETPVLLVGRSDLDAAFVDLMLAGLFANVDTLLQHHERSAEQIGVQRAFPDLPVAYHDGAVAFREREKQKLLIAAGALGGLYYQKGKAIEMLLRNAGVPARTLHTGGSLENARILQNPELHALAIMQYDAALAAHWGKPRAVYKTKLDFPEDLHVPGLRSIASLHEEWVHVVARRHGAVDENVVQGDSVHGLDRRAPGGEGLRVCLGPAGSATQVLAQAVLRHHRVEPAIVLHLPFREMKARLLAGDVDAGFVVAGKPSILIQDLLEEEGGMGLLGLEHDDLARLTGATAALRAATFDPEHDAYACLRRPGPPVRTLKTRAVLVTTEDLPFDVVTITRAVFQGAGLLGAGSAAEAEQKMAAPLASLDLHPDAGEVYRERGLLPTPEDRTVEILAALLSIVVVLVGGWRGSQILMHDRAVNAMRGKILDISLSASEHDSVRKLNAAREEVRERAHRKLWRPGRLDKRAWHDLEAMLDERVSQAMATLSRTLVAEARGLAGRTGEEAKADREALEAKLWRQAERGELNEIQVLLVLRALDEQ